MSFVVVDLNGWDDVVEHVWGFPSRQDAEDFRALYWGYGYTVHEIESPSTRSVVTER